MSFYRFWVAALLLVSSQLHPFPTSVGAPIEAQPAASTAITDVTLIDGTGAAPRAHMTVVITGRRIADVFADGSKSITPNARRIDGRGRFLIPGLIDAHIHMGTMPDRPRNVADGVLRAALLGGVTSARDMGGQGTLVRSLAARAAIDTIPSPRIYYSAIIAGPGMWFEGARGQFMAEGGPIGSAALVHLVTDTTNIPRMITAARLAGATGIKLYNTLTASQLKAIGEEAHRQGLRVWSHLAVDPARPSDVVAAGVSVVSHADQFIHEVMSTPVAGEDVEAMRTRRHRAFLSTPIDTQPLRRLLATMRARGVILDPTLYIMTPRPDSTGHVTERGAALYRFATSMVRAARLAGVRIDAGTDALGGSSPNIHVELQLLVDSTGMSPLEAITAATLNGARAIGIADSVGTVRPGNVADLVLLSADPTIDIANTQTVRSVFKAGVEFRRESPMRPPPFARAPKGITGTSN